MKVGILGTGKIVQEFLPWLVEHAPFTVQALCSTPRSAEKAQELCRQYGVPQHTTNYLELLQWVDVVYIAVPNLQHVRFARVALEAGKHVIVEKPLAPSAAQTEELVALARHKKVFLFEAVTTQYLENYAKIRELLPRVGTVRLVQCNFSQYSSRYDAFCAGETPPVFDPACAGGALMDLGVYNVSYIVGLFGEPNQVHYTANVERGIDTSGILTMDYTGFKAVSMAAKDCAAPARCIIQGTKGYIQQKSTANCCGGITFHRGQGRALQPERGPPPGGRRVRDGCPGDGKRRPGAVHPHAGHLHCGEPGAHGGTPVGRHPLPRRTITTFPLWNTP